MLNHQQHLGLKKMLIRKLYSHNNNLQKEIL